MLNQNQELLVVKFETPSNQEPFYNHQSNEVKMSLKLNAIKGNKKLTAKFQLNKNSQIRDFILSGRDAQALIALVEAKQRGTTALEISSWGLRLAAYIFNLRNDCGLNIATITENHNDLHYGRYILQDNIKILEVSDPKNQGVLNV